MNTKTGFEFAAPWWRGTRLSYSSGAGVLVVELPGRGPLVYRDVPARVYDLLRNSPEMRAASVEDDGRSYSIPEGR